MKEMSSCHKLKFSNPYIFAVWKWKTFGISNLEYLIYQNSKFLVLPLLLIRNLNIIVEKMLFRKMEVLF